MSSVQLGSPEGGSPRYELPADTRARLGGLPRHETQAITSALLDEYRTKIDELQAHMLQVASIQNPAALVHVVLPRELLMHIFRSIHPNSPSAIRVTHVCRLWRRLVDAIPEFWEFCCRVPIGSSSMPRGGQRSSSTSWPSLPRE